MRESTHQSMTNNSGVKRKQDTRGKQIVGSSYWDAHDLPLIAVVVTFIYNFTF